MTTRAVVTAPCEPARLYHPVSERKYNCSMTLSTPMGPESNRRPAGQLRSAGELIPLTGVSPPTALAAEYGDATVLGDGTATTARVLEAIDGAGLAHIAAHGVFRADSPLFSCLRLDDGPMTVYDLGRLRRAPFRLILPSCESALLAPAGADELLGLASALLPLGTAGIVAQVSDRAAAPLMLALHRRLGAAGPGPGALAAALRDARADACRATADDPVVMAAGWSFIALGA